ncbi:MAG: type II CRISPR RNA-guided endonuclease Cas9 [Defluviicoccus sp.]
MARIFGLDIGTTSIGFAVIDHEPDVERGRILRLGVRVFPEARDPDGTPLNQTRRQKRMVRRQMRRRKDRRRLLNETLAEAGLLPAFNAAKWPAVMATDPYDLRTRGLTEALSAHELGRALYHLAHRRHFRGRDVEESDNEGSQAAEEKEAKTEAEKTCKALKDAGTTLGAWLAERNPLTSRRRGAHALRTNVQDEFEKVWSTQAAHHPVLRQDGFKSRVEDAIFAQRPVFWRKNTLGECRFMPGAPLCPKGAWLSQQRRMLEKLNNLALAGGNARPLEADERTAILAKLQTQASMSWAGVRAALKPLFASQGEPGAEKKLLFNLEMGDESKLLGNPLEAKLAAIFGAEWANHPRKQAIRAAVHERLWSADYGEIRKQRVVIRSERERAERRQAAAESFILDFAVTAEQAEQLKQLSFPTGWEPFSAQALEAFLPRLEAGVRFGELLNGPAWEDWRNETFPNRLRPTGEILPKLPSPRDPYEQERLGKIRNPTVVRVQNELRKVVNNLIGLHGKPDFIRVEVAREVGLSKREREEKQSAIRRNEGRRRAATKDLEAKGIAQPARADVEKWLLWKECRERCPYTGDEIGFDALFRENDFQVEHIWPRWRSFDDSFANKTLCRRDINLAKANRTPFEYLSHDAQRWQEIQSRLNGMIAKKGGEGMSPGKVRRFLAKELLEDFASRQLNDTGYAAREAMACLKRLWPDVGPQAPVNVQAITGRVTAQLRKLWGLNNILSDDGEKTRADHRHHSIDALTVACTHPGMTNKLSRYWQAKDDQRAERPDLPPPWPSIRADAAEAVAAIVVSHRVRKKVSGPLHKETVYGDTGEADGIYRFFVTRKKVEALTKGDLSQIRDERVRQIVQAWVADHGGEPKKAFPPYPRLGADGPEVRKVRLLTKQQIKLMAQVATGYADLGANHHIAIYRSADGKAVFEVVSLFEAARRLARREPVVQRQWKEGATFVMSLAPGDSVQFAKEKDEAPRVWRVQKIASKGQISLLDHADASPNEWSLFEPMVGGLISRGATKLSIDPIGRVRPAND